MHFPALLALVLPLLTPVLAAPNAAPIPEVEVAPAPACSDKRDLIVPYLEERGCPYASRDDCYNRFLNCVVCNNPHGCTGDNPVACTYCIAYCNANC